MEKVIVTEKNIFGYDMSKRFEKFQVNLPFDATKKKVEEFVADIFSVKKSQQIGKDFVIYPAYDKTNERCDGFYDEVTITIRKLNNSQSIVIAQFDDTLGKDDFGHENWRNRYLLGVYKDVKNILPEVLNIKA